MLSWNFAFCGTISPWPRRGASPAPPGLRLSQPTLSKQLKDLEGELGKKLFVCGSFSVRLTEEGMLLRKRAEEILDMVDKTEEECKALGEASGGDIHIGAAESDGVKYLARRIKAVQARYPRIRVHLYSGGRSGLARRLDQGLLDFAVLMESSGLSQYNCIPPAWRGRLGRYPAPGPPPGGKGGAHPGGPAGGAPDLPPAGAGKGTDRKSVV